MRTAPIDVWLSGREWYVRGAAGKDPRQADWGFEAEFPNERITVTRPLAIVEQEPEEDYIWVLNIQFVYSPPESTALPKYSLLLARKVVSKRQTDILPDPKSPWPIYWLVGLKKS